MSEFPKYLAFLEHAVRRRKAIGKHVKGFAHGKCLREAEERGRRGWHLDVHSVIHQVFTEHLLCTAHCPSTKCTAVSKTDRIHVYMSNTLGLSLTQFLMINTIFSNSIIPQAFIQ